MSPAPPEITERSLWSRGVRRVRRQLQSRTAKDAGEVPKKLGVGLVGLGNVVRWLYLPRLRRNDSPFALKAVYDVDAAIAEQCAALFRAAACSSVESLTGHPEVDVVFVCTPVRFHGQAVLAALEARKHVLCEKPLGLSKSEAERMALAARIAGTTHMVNFSYRFRPDLDFVGRILRSGIIGQVHHLWGSISQGQWFDESGQPSNQRADASKWKYAPDGGIILDLLPHALDLFRTWFGDIRRVQAWKRSMSQDSPAVDVACGCALHFDSGSAAHLLMSRLATGHREQLLLDISGSRGALRLDQDKLTLWTSEKPRWRNILLPSEGPDFLHLFRAAIDGQSSEPIPSFDDGVINNDAIDAVILSAQAGAEVSLPIQEPAT